MNVLEFLELDEVKYLPIKTQDINWDRRENSIKISSVLSGDTSKIFYCKNDIIKHLNEFKKVFGEAPDIVEDGWGFTFTNNVYVNWRKKYVNAKARMLDSWGTSE